MDHLDSFTYRNGRRRGQILDTAQQERIRQALLAYMQAHAIGVPKLAKHIHEANPGRPEIVIKTLQRFVAGRKVNEKLMGFCDHFTAKLPHRPTLWHAVGDALFAIFKKEMPPDIAFEDPDASLTPTGPFALISLETKNGPADGVLSGLTPELFVAIARERLMLKPHVILYTLQQNELIPSEDVRWRRSVQKFRDSLPADMLNYRKSK